MPKTGPQVYLWGWYGHKNSGDDALLKVISRTILQVSPTTGITIGIPEDGQVPPLPNVVRVNRPIHRFKGYILFSKIISVLGTNALVFGGGSAMSDISKARMDGLRFHRWICTAAKLKRIPIIFSALGLGPLITERGKSLTRDILNSAVLVDVRDSDSYELCKKLNVTSQVIQSFDPAVLIPELFYPDLTRRRYNGRHLPTVGISLSGSPGTVQVEEHQQKIKIANLARAIKHTAASLPLQVAGIEMCGDDIYGDKQLIERLLNDLDNVCEVKTISYCLDPVDMMRQLAGLDAIIAERLHAAVYAYTLGIPFAVVPYHAKCKAFARDIGLPDALLLEPEMPTTQVEQVLKLMLNEPDACSPALAVDQASRLAQSGQEAILDTLRKLLSSTG